MKDTIILFLSVLLLFSCNFHPTAEKKISFFIDEKDSLTVIEEIRNNLRTELHQTTENHKRDTSFAQNPLTLFQGRGRSTFTILVNAKNEITVKNRFPSISIKKLKGAILTFYQTNNQNNISLSFPMYSKTTLKRVKTQLNELYRTLGKNKSFDSTNQISIRIRKGQIEQWQQREKTLQILKKDTLREIMTQTRLKLDYPPQTTIHNQLIDTILQAYIELRDSVAQKHFQESYARVFRRYQQQKNTNDLNKLEVLETLCRICVFIKPMIKKIQNTALITNTHINLKAKIYLIENTTLL